MERTRDTTEKLATQRGLATQCGRCGKLAGAVAMMEIWIHELTGYVKEAWQGIAVERGRISNPSGFVLPRLLYRF